MGFIGYRLISPDSVSDSDRATWAYNTEIVASGLSVPWGIDFLPNGDMLVTERSGTLYLKKAGATASDLQAISGVPHVVSRGQGGLLDVETHPKYSENGWVYLTYSKRDPDSRRNSTTAVVRGKLENNAFTNQEEIFVAEPYLRTTHHYGSRLQFDKEGFLFVTVGDRGFRDENPQSLKNHSGKVHRIHDDGRIPEDNPFVGTSGAKGSIYSYGHRNPQGMVIHPESGVIWEHEHGPRGGDELNVIEPGKNYGWPVISYGINYDGSTFTDLTAKDGMEQPATYWVPSIAPSGTDFVTGGAYGNLEGALLVGSLKFQYVERVNINSAGKVTGKDRMLRGIGRVRDIKTGPDGFVYIAVEGPGRVVRLLPN